MTHRHYVLNRSHRRGLITEHPIEEKHKYLHGVFPLDNDDHPRPPGEPDLDMCRVPETDDELLMLLKRSIKRLQEKKRG